MGNIMRRLCLCDAADAAKMSAMRPLQLSREIPLRIKRG